MSDSFNPFDVERYYPPSEASLNYANADLNTLRATSDLGGLIHFEQTLSDASVQFLREWAKEHGACEPVFNPYADILHRCVNVRYVVTDTERAKLFT